MDDDLKGVTVCNSSQDRKSAKQKERKRKLKDSKRGNGEEVDRGNRDCVTELKQAETGATTTTTQDTKPVDFLSTYEPVSIPIVELEEKSLGKNSTGTKQLGKWFPNASVVKSKPAGNSKCSLVLFYQYTNPHWNQHQLSTLLDYLTVVARRRNLGGRIRVAQEGVNATISSGGVSRDTSALGTLGGGFIPADDCLRHFAEDLRRFDRNAFNSTDFKFIDDLAPDRHFKELRLLPVQELVYYGIKEEDAPLASGGVHLDARDYHAMLEKPNTIVVDVRNHYEADIGRFVGQISSNETNNRKRPHSALSPTEEGSVAGAEYVNPKMRKSTDFPRWLDLPETRQNLAGKTVLMYCTGGVRCERASAYLQKQMGSDVEGIYQLKGGIERYLQEFPDGGHWRGENFVFDKREAIGVGNRDGVGGVISKARRKKNCKPGAIAGAEECAHHEVVSRCCTCGTPWNRYVGKKKCHTCGVPVLMCDACMSKKPDKTPGMELSVRCPLCKEEDITVPASNVEYTENGTRGKVVPAEFHKSADLTSIRGQAEKEGRASRKGKRAASSVLKWGGGHAVDKKKNRKLKQRMCRYGTDCTRKDCIFMHPAVGGGHGNE